uniref:4-nitrophenylphosphatase n=2 Tax=Panagrellus redivivus TaxID=6233 RepID=A0A7E4ZRU0_PANRE
MTFIPEPTKMNSDKFRKVLRDIDTFIFDADGVLWLGEDVMPGSPDFLDHLIKLGKRVIVLTNNATKSRAVYAKKLAAMGYHPSITKDSIVNPAAVVADTLHRAGIHRTDKKMNERDDMVPEFYADCLGALAPRRHRA